MPDSLTEFLSTVEPDEAARIWRWIEELGGDVGEEMVGVIAGSHPHLFELPKKES